MSHEANESFGVRVTKMTVGCSLIKANLNARASAVKPLIRMKNRNSRLACVTQLILQIDGG